MTDIWGGPPRPQQSAARGTFRPSPVFLAIVAAFVGAGWALWTDALPAKYAAFLFVVAGWVLSLCLHEYAHAVVAYHGGDRSVAAQGYLTLDPRRYTHAVYSIVLPLLFVLLGGIGLPGGAVFINHAALPGRLRKSLVSAAGPLTNIVFALATLVPVALAGVSGATTHLAFWAALAFLGFLQVTASVLNLLPVPGLDGFGIVEPWLPRDTARSAAKVAPYGLLLLFALLWIPPLNAAFFRVVYWFLGIVGVPEGLVGLGDTLFRFWLAV
jgi:Zn-dependent protease